MEENGLLQLCMIVKNAGDGFADILKHNKQYIDYWTILDTGSTDKTIEIIMNVMSDIPGNLYEEPFINFGESRNRCLDLAENKCEYIIMLDDTHMIFGDLRKILSTSLQDVDSFNVWINKSNCLFQSNRILRTSSNLRYIFRIHEVINWTNNKIEIIDQQNILIIDQSSDYMNTRTAERQRNDLILLHQDLQEYNDSRTLYYLGQTYMDLGEWENAIQYFQQRSEREGFIEEIATSYGLRRLHYSFLGISM